MKQLFLTSMAILAISCPAFANIDKDASTATCDNATIGTTTGPANLQADWTANTINLKWYNDGNEIILQENDPSKTCSYDGAIVLPTTQPTKTGYNFAGWKKTCRLIFRPENYNESCADRIYTLLTKAAGVTEEEVTAAINSPTPVILKEPFDCNKAKKIKQSNPSNCRFAMDFE